MKPLIGVTPDFNAGDRKDMGGREPTYFLRARYARAIEELGGVPVILPLTDDPTLQRRLFDGLDGLLLTGSGPDLPPSLYGERQRYKFRVMSRQRYAFEQAMVGRAMKSPLPVFGICGGMQAINVALGGSLVQDIGAQLPKALQHRAPGPATEYAHSVRVAPDSLLRRITGNANLRVNSSHHQSIKTVAPALVATAVAPDGVIEAIEATDRRRHPFLLGVQWHPEYLFDRYAVQRRLFEAFLQAARSESQR
ncbi:MAG: gamma-glutamyl-gamma-aminobutyrate hydrolase family protein [Nitrospirota bacterium]|nr:gamma-glutamyl-gamma-aminobutyrate hydrolase family protein [Nitrospirota bacterium]